MTKNRFITEAEFDELCKYVCCQLTPSGIEHLDVETLNFAIYWQICRIFEQRVEMDFAADSKIDGYRQNMQKVLCEWLMHPFDLLYIVDKNVFEKVSDWYQDKLAFNFENLQESFAV